MTTPFDKRRSPHRKQRSKPLEPRANVEHAISKMIGVVDAFAHRLKPIQLRRLCRA